MTGWMLIFVAMGIGSAAYNTASNILFMTLSLMLSSLVLSGVLSLINLKKLRWTLKAPAHLQVDEVGVTEIELENKKRLFPSMSISFHLGTSGEDQDATLHMPHALSAGESTRLEWTFTPRRRGLCQIQLKRVASKFPFGFLDKSFGESQEQAVLVWPGRRAYSFRLEGLGTRYFSGLSRQANGTGNDLLNIRQYVAGDAPRLIHWKASARLNKIMIRQLAQEGEGGFHLELNPEKDLWTASQFEVLCALACTLADDLFHAGRLDSVCILKEAPVLIRSLRDLHAFFDQLALLSPTVLRQAAGRSDLARNRITFRPLEGGGIAIYVDDIYVGQAED